MEKFYPDWLSYSKNRLKNSTDPFINFSSTSMPGYIENEDYPFTYNNSLTHGSINFSGTDGPKEFEKNLKTQPSNWKYRTKNIEYIVNRNGYRTKNWEEINWRKAIVLFGCSCTFGVGLAEDETIAYHLSLLTGREVVNMGYPAGSNELIVNNCAAMIKNFGIPYGVVINWSTTDRFRFYTETDYHDLGPWTPLKEGISHVQNNVDMQNYWEMTFVNLGNEYAKNYYWSTYTDAMFEGRCKYAKVSYFGLSAYCTRSDKWIEIDNKARDLIHPGEKNSIEVANFVRNKFNERL